jgi:hypothetical protein
MPSRRTVIGLCGLAAASALSGCSTTDEQPKQVDVLLQNDDTEAWQLTVAVERESGDELFRTENTIPADDGTLGEVLVEDAFEGSSGDRFIVRVWLDDDPAGTFDYEITCPRANRLSLLVEHHDNHADGEPVDYVPDRCAE